MRKPKKLLSVLLCASAISSVCALGFINNTNAVDINTLNDSSVFVKQQQSDTCTLASNVMLLRRAALLRGDSDWQSITEGACSSSLWVGGMRFTYTYKNFTVDCERIYGNSTETLKKLLSEHPEGIVAYDYDYPHAVLLTDYTNGKFYCSDPARCCGYGRIEADRSLVDTSDIEAYWYIKNGLSDVSLTQLKNTSIISASEVNAGSKVTLTGSADNYEGKCTYTYQFRRAGNSLWQTIDSNTTNDSASFIPSVGEYEARVVVEDSKGNSSEKLFKVVSYENLQNNSSIDTKKVAYGNNVVLNLASLYGSGKYQYEINAIKPSTSDWINLRKFCSSSSYVYHPWEIGTYKLQVVAKDSTGAVSTKEFSFEVYAAPLSNTSTISSDSIKFGETINFELSAAGGMGGYKYEINAMKPSSDTFVNFRKSSSLSTYTYRPWEVGTYRFNIVCRDNKGTVSVKNLYFTVTAEDLVNTSTISSQTIKYGETVDFLLSANGGTGSYKYEINAVKPSSLGWANFRKYNSFTSYTYRPWERGTYSFSIRVKDLTGNITARYFTLTVE